MHTSFDGKVDVEFDFWGASETQYYSNDRGASEVEFQALVEEDFVDYSLPLWKADMSRNVRNESSPLLPRGHHYSNISPSSRLQVMAEGRRKLMEIIHSMPESSYELSLKDIVDEQQISEGAQDEMPKQRTTSDFKSEAQIIKKQKTKKTKSFSKSGNISRSRSMEKENFLIKMFIPTSLSFKIRDNKRNGSKVLPRSSMELTDNREDKKWWIKCKNSGKSSSTRTSSSSDSSTRTSSSDSSKSRYDNMEALPSCWPFFRTKKTRRTRLEGHIF
ncbi:PREDICTED: uncharacterized protein LOC105130382 [Populus euphratica]|uniref:Uncharacterized protein LOC105130382 n=1 Tax=Populus euphratica TaxID=75702 RepID=A0AAJ6XU66_POPEU|nr:PREDICTED: uncharacterized protein LOC105130382 [Populus euphratica]